MQPITITTTINAPVEKVWDMWTLPEHITNWAFASDTWEAPYADNDVTVNGRFKTTMSAKDGSASFDLTGTYTGVEVHKLIAYTMDGDDARKVSTTFESNGETTTITETFDPEHENPIEMQRDGWQSILDNFKKYVESH
jgi:uncharacterized protein YndB with AHSA1/START domain